MRFAIAAVLSMAVCALGATSAMAASFTPGNLAVLRVGDGTLYGTTPSFSNSNPLFIDEYTTAGVLVQTFAAPTSTNGTSNRVSLSGTATKVGQLTLTSNGNFLTFAANDAPPGIIGVSSTSSFPNRVVAVVDLNGGFDTSTSFAAGGTTPRSAVSSNGTDLYIGFDTGSGTTGGVRYITKGSATNGTLIGPATQTNMNTVEIYSGQLYASGAATTPTNYRGVSTIGTGLPTTGGQALTLLPGMTTASTDSSMYDFAFADSGSTLYVADLAASTTNGLQKWTLSSGTWTKQYTITSGLTSAATGLEGLTVTNDGTNNVIYGVSTDGLLVTLTDTGSGAAFTTLAAPGANQVFRGVDFAPVPEPASLGLLAAGGMMLLGRRRRQG